MLNYVTRMFVGKPSGAANTGNTIASLASGDLLLVDADTNAPITTAAQAAAASAIQVLQGTERVGFPLSSQPIIRSAVSKFTEQVFSPAVAQVDSLDFSALSAGKQVRVLVIFKDDRRLIANKQTRGEIYHKTPATGFVLATEIDKIVARINKDRVLGSFLVAARSGNAITLTGQPIFSDSVLDKYTFVKFESRAVEVTGETSYGTGIAYPAVTTTEAQGGNGLGVQVMEQERQAQGKLGVTDYRNFDRLPAPLFSTAATNYDVYHFTHSVKSQGDFQELVEHPLQTSIAVATNSSQGNAFQALLEAFVSGLATAAPAGE